MGMSAFGVEHVSKGFGFKPLKNPSVPKPIKPYQPAKGLDAIEPKRLGGNQFAAKGTSNPVTRWAGQQQNAARQRPHYGVQGAGSAIASGDPASANWGLRQTQNALKARNAQKPGI